MLLDVSAAAPSAAALLQAAEEPLTQHAAQRGIALTVPDLSGDRDAAFAAFAPVFREAASGLPDADVQSLAFEAIDAMAHSINDAHTRFAPPTTNPSPRSAGMLLSAYGSQIFVREIAPNGAAAAAGVLPGDVLVSINDEHVPGDLAAANRMLAALSDAFTVRVDRPGVGRLDFRLTPGPAQYPTWTSMVLPGALATCASAPFRFLQPFSRRAGGSIRS
jgi:membrane-associated protease RseP (regulator of RpoE activity)